MHFAIRVTRHSRNLWVVSLEGWTGGIMSRHVERRDTSFARAFTRARAEFRTKRRAAAG